MYFQKLFSEFNKLSDIKIKIKRVRNFSSITIYYLKLTYPILDENGRKYLDSRNPNTGFQLFSPQTRHTGVMVLRTGIYPKLTLASDYGCFPHRKRYSR